MISVLYVDDERSLLEIGKLFLEEDRELSVDIATSAREALKSPRLLQYDAIISDYQMPVTDGIDFLKEIRRSGNTVPFILFTGKGREEIVIQALNEGADFYLQKGGDTGAQFAELAHIINRIVRHHAAEVSLKASEERYRNVVEGQTEFISRFTPEGVHVFANDAYLRYFSRAREELIGHRFVPEIPHEDAARLRDHFASLTRVHPTAAIEHRIVMPDGSIRWQQWTDTAFFDRNGTVTEYQSVGRDITENKVAEEAVRESEARLRSVLASSPVPQFVIDRDHRIISWNRAMEEYSGISAADMLGTDQQWRAFYRKKRPVLADLLIENNREELLRWYAGNLHRSRYVPGACESLEFFSHMGPAGKWLTHTAAPIRDAGGTVIGAIETLEDITERSRAEEALRKSEARFRELFDNMTMGVAVYDAVAGGSDFIFRDLNTAGEKIDGISRRDVIGRSVLAVFSGIKEFGLFDVLQRVWRTGTPEAFPVSFYRDSRISGWRENFIYRLPSGEIVVIYEDVTEKVQAGSDLRKAREWLGIALRSAQAGTWDWDIPANVLTWSPEFSELFGLPPDAPVTFETWLAVLHPDDRKTAIATIEQSIRDHNGFWQEYRIVLSDGQERWIGATGSTTYTDTGEPLRTSGLCLNITERRKAEDALRKSEEKYRRIIETSLEGIWILDAGSRITYANSRMADLLGFRPEEMVGLQVADFVHPGDIADFTRRMRERRSGVTSRFERRYNRRDGSTITLLVSASPIMDDDGTFRGSFAMFTDITDRKKAEDALKESEARLKSVLAGSPIPQFVIDRNHHIISWNRALEEYSGISAADMLGTDRQWRAFYPEKRPVLADLLIEEDTDGLARWYGEKLRKSKYVPGAYESLDFFPHMGPGGTWLAFTAAPIRNAGGTVIGAIETLEDITDRKVTEEELRKSEEKYHNLYENAVIGIYRIAPGGQFLDANARAARILGYDSADELIRSVTDVGTQVYADPARRLEAARVLREHGSLRNFEAACRHRDGHIVWVSFNARSIRDANGTVLYYEGTSEDITDRKEAEDALHQANRKLNLLTSITWHDIRNQLHALKGYLELSLKNVQDPEKSVQYLRSMDRVASAIERQILFTREFEQTGAGRQVWQNVLECAIHSAREFILPGVSMDTSGLGRVEILATPMLQKVFSNLIDNALRHGGSAMTAIRFSSRSADGRFVIACENNGADISAEDKERIFVRGYGKNTGDGLFLVREILEMTGITIAETGEPGRGARFEIVVPEGAWRPAGEGT